MKSQDEGRSLDIDCVFVVLGDADAVRVGQVPGTVLLHGVPLHNMWFLQVPYPGGLLFYGADRHQYWVVQEGIDWSVQDDTGAEVFRSDDFSEVVEWIEKSAAVNPFASVIRGRRPAKQGYHPATVSERSDLKISYHYVDIHVADDPAAPVLAYGFDAFDMWRDLTPTRRS